MQYTHKFFSILNCPLTFLMQQLVPFSFEGLYLHISTDHSLMYASFVSHIWVLKRFVKCGLSA